MTGKQPIFWGVLMALAGPLPLQPQQPSDYAIQPVPFTEVRLQDRFWLPRMETNRKVTIPVAWEHNEKTGRLANFDRAAGSAEGPYMGRRFNDTDIYKVLEASSYSLAMQPDARLDSYLDAVIAKIAAAQEPDGYLYPARTVDPQHPARGAGNKRWVHLFGSHELYNSGHLFEAAVAHYRATGKRNLLNIAIKNADMIASTFGPDKRLDTSGHQEIEIGLVRLYRVTGNRKYLDLAQFFLDQRGRPHESEPYPKESDFAIYNNRPYRQDHLPVTEQSQAVGHAVRATYLYAGMADVAALLQPVGYRDALGRIWNDVVGGKLYLTGGVGARHTVEAFGDPYELPNRQAYTETCAAIGNAFWNHRQFLLHGDGRYVDVLERIVYNGLISGVSLEGKGFFYQNPLASIGDVQRQPWFEVACCPGNIARFLPSFPGYVYATKGNSIYVNMFAAGQADIKLPQQTVRIEQQTDYPWEGKVTLQVEPNEAAEFTLLMRIPGWARNQVVPSDLYRFAANDESRPSLTVNGVVADKPLERGYLRIHRLWRPGDQVELNLPMPVRRVVCHPQVVANRNRVALQRGPLVYCAEGIDNNGNVLDIEISDRMVFQAKHREDLLGGVTTLIGDLANRVAAPAVETEKTTRHALMAIPYYAWANRGKSEMAVWLRRAD